MLHGQDGGGDKDSGLFPITGRFESRPDCYLRLAESYIAAYQTVHRAMRLHILFDVVGRLELVGGILIDERGLQLVLQIRVG